jgi:hypothetical protein
MLFLFLAPLRHSPHLKNTTNVSDPIRAKRFAIEGESFGQIIGAKSFRCSPGKEFMVLQKLTPF